MHEIILRQHDAARKLDGKGFVLGIAGILLKLSIAQIVCNGLISLTGIGLINLAFYLYAVWLLFMFMRGTVASYVYTLMEDKLVLERRLGDSTITVVEVPLESIAAMRPVRMGERLETAYRDVMVIDPAGRPAARVRAAFALSLISSRLARLAAGKGVNDVIGHVVVYDRGTTRHACVFCPNEEMCRALEERLCERFGFDERMTHNKIRTLYSRALQRAFPALYAYVDPLVNPKDVQWAKEELAGRKAERKAAAAAKAEKQAEKKNAKNERPKNKQAKTGKTGAPEAPQASRRRRKQG